MFGLIGRPVLVGHSLSRGIIVQIDIGIMAVTLVISAIERQEGAGLIAPVHEMMTIRNVLGKRRTVAGAHDRLPAFLDEHRLAFQHDDKLVDAFVPVALARPGAWFEHAMADADIPETRRLADAPVVPAGNVVGIGRWIAGAVGLLDLGKIDFRHGKRLATPMP